MTSPTVYIRKTRDSHLSVMIETTDIHEIQNMLLSGVPISRVPVNLHSSLLGPLSATRTEFLIAGKIDEAHKVHDIINELQLSAVKPTRSRPSTTSSLKREKLSLIQSMKDSTKPSDLLEKKGCEIFWNNEIQRFIDMKAEDLESLENKYGEKIAVIENRRKPTITARATSALVSLRAKQAAMPINRQTADQRAELAGRIEYNIEIDQRSQKRKIEHKFNQKITKMKNNLNEERLQRERTWDKRWQELLTARNEDLRRRSQSQMDGVLDRSARSLVVRRLRLSL